VILVLEEGKLQAGKEHKEGWRGEEWADFILAEGGKKIKPVGGKMPCQGLSSPTLRHTTTQTLFDLT